MHVTSMENMERCYRRFVEGTELEKQERSLVLDLGGADLNGSYRDLFRAPCFDYIGADIAPGEGVSLVLGSPYEIPLEDASVDIVLSGQMLEHCEFFWQSFAEMVRVLKPSGFIFLIAPSAGPEHRYPVDCYRFYPDAYRALARYAGCELVDVWRDARGPWEDLVGVFRRKDAPPLAARALAPRDAEPAPPAIPGSAEEEAAAGSTPVPEVMQELHRTLKPRACLEIGARDAAFLSLAHCPALGIGPHAGAIQDLPENVRTVAAASGDFFFGRGNEPVTDPAPDLIFLDGSRFFECVLHDFMQAERLSSPASLVVVNHALPNHPAQGARARSTQLWAGEVWKLYDALRIQRPDLVLIPLDANPAGLLLVGGLDRKNDLLWKGFNWVVDEYGRGRDVPPPEILSRGIARAPSPEFIGGIARLLRKEREQGARVFRVREKLRQFVKESAAAQA